MGSRVRPWIVALAIAVLISALAPFGSGISQGAEPPVLVVISPPPALRLPVGQHAGVHYRFTGETPAIVELTADGIPLFTDWVGPGQAVTHAWTPATPGLHQLRVRALAPDGTVLSSTSVRVFGLPAGSPVQIP